MAEKTNNELIRELARLCKDDDGPFPYDDYRKILREAGKKYSELSPDLNRWGMDILGCCSRGWSVLNWPKDEVEHTKKVLSLSFYEKHPEYTPLVALITASATPDLDAYLVIHEKMRQTFLELLSRWTV